MSTTTTIVLIGSLTCLILIVSNLLWTKQQENLVRLVLRQREWVHPLELLSVTPEAERVLVRMERRGEVVASRRGRYWRLKRGS